MEIKLNKKTNSLDYKHNEMSYSLVNLAPLNVITGLRINEKGKYAAWSELYQNFPSDLLVIDPVLNALDGEPLHWTEIYKHLSADLQKLKNTTEPMFLFTQSADVIDTVINLDFLDYKFFIVYDDDCVPFNKELAKKVWSSGGRLR